MHIKVQYVYMMHVHTYALHVYAHVTCQLCVYVNHMQVNQNPMHPAKCTLTVNEEDIVRLLLCNLIIYLCISPTVSVNSSNGVRLQYT